MTVIDKLKQIIEKYQDICPSLTILVLNGLPLTSSISSIIKSLESDLVNVMFIFHYTITIENYKVTSDSDHLSLNTLIYHPITPLRYSQVFLFYYS